MKKVWIFNHYATNGYVGHGGRHYGFAKNLIQNGYGVRIFCASTRHNATENFIKDCAPYIEIKSDDIPYVLVKCRSYLGSKFKRILNMFDYFFGLFKLKDCFEKPDVIIGSSAHPLACIAAIRLSKYFKCKNIVEIRDLWPESFVAYGLMSSKNLIIKILYSLERRIYAKADAIIFTMEGGRDYVIEKRWDSAHGGPVDLEKIYHINNGVDIEQFEYNQQKFTNSENELDSGDQFKVVYTGSIRLVNQVENLVDVAACLRDKAKNNIQILIWGVGDHVDIINQRINSEGLQNIRYMGVVPKMQVPGILSKADLNVLLLADSPLYRFGLSANKLFEYFASEKPILSSRPFGYSQINKYQCGLCLDEYTPAAMAEAIVFFVSMRNDQYEKMCAGAKRAAHDYDFGVLTKKLIDVLETI